MKILELYNGFIPFINDIISKYKLDELNTTESGDRIIIDMIIVPKKLRKNGIGSKVICEIIKYANDNNKMVVLNAIEKNTNIGTTSKNRLIKFFKRHGFVENKGRNINTNIEHEMYKEHQNV